MSHGFGAPRPILEDVLVKHEGEGDPTFRAALEALRAKMGKEAHR